MTNQRDDRRRRERLVSLLVQWSLLELFGFGVLLWELVGRHGLEDTVINFEEVGSRLDWAIVMTLVGSVATKGLTWMYKEHNMQMTSIRVQLDRPAVVNLVVVTLLPICVGLLTGGFGFSITGAWSGKVQPEQAYTRAFECVMILRIGLLASLTAAPTIVSSGVTIVGNSQLPAFTMYSPKMDSKVKAVDPKFLILPVLSAYTGMVVGSILMNFCGAFDTKKGSIDLQYYGFPVLPMICFSIFGIAGAVANTGRLLVFLLNK
eukprot:GHVH01003763.1.p1 GENE.GHVH01003763.1~~GHVH01003763.1.p1  ORF type:complete len:262 (+),score=22.40 GHVH01003763.1:58-843(+)